MTDAFDVADFKLTDFDTPDGGVPRDQYDRPLILQPDGTLEPYTRTSTLAGLATDGVGLAIWKTRHVALAVARNEDYAAVIKGLEYGSPDLDKYIESALERARMSEPANWGTAVHRFTEPGAPAPVERVRADVDSYAAELERTGIEVICTEMFCVNDRLKVAGTFDHLYRLTRDTEVTFRDNKGKVTRETTLLAGTVIVGDKKTGKLKPLQLTVQLSTYAGSMLYDPAAESYETSRTPLADHVAGLLDGAPFDASVGLSVHIPLGEGRTEFGFVDLEPGRGLASSLMHMHMRRSAESVAALLAPVPDRTDVLACLHGTPACELCTAGLMAHESAVIGRAKEMAAGPAPEAARPSLAEVAEQAAERMAEHMEASRVAVRLAGEAIQAAAEGALRKPPTSTELAETATAVLDELAARRGGTPPVKSATRRRRRTKAEMEAARAEAARIAELEQYPNGAPPAPDPPVVVPEGPAAAVGRPVQDMELPAEPAELPDSTTWVGRITHAKSRAELSAIWREASAAGQWTRELEAEGKIRLQQLSAKA